MNNPEVSIIVPVYNAEAYIRRCLDSILAQTFENFEVLLIDDGSIDATPAICDEYAAMDSRVKVFHKENGGVASARQVGVQNARGEYSIHADGDDWVDADMLETMLSAIKQNDSDVLIADFKGEASGGSTYSTQKPGSLEPLDVAHEIIVGNLHGSLCNKLIRHSLYRKYDIRFIDGLNYCEDVMVLVRLFAHPVRISYLNRAFYHYNYQNESSITRNYTLATFRMRQKYISCLAEYIPAELKQDVDIAAFGVKREAFIYGVLSADDYYHYYPTPLKTILASPMSLTLRICLVLAWARMYGLVMSLKSMKNTVGRLLRRFRK